MEVEERLRCRRIDVVVESEAKNAVFIGCSDVAVSRLGHEHVPERLGRFGAMEAAVDEPTANRNLRLVHQARDEYGADLFECDA